MSGLTNCGTVCSKHIPLPQKKDNHNIYGHRNLFYGICIHNIISSLHFACVNIGCHIVASPCDAAARATSAYGHKEGQLSHCTSMRDDMGLVHIHNVSMIVFL